MIFSSREYFIFFSAVLLVLALLRGKMLKKWLLLAASIYFYAYWDYRFAALMLVVSVANFYLGKQVEVSGSVGAKKRWLASAIVFDLGILGFFKYYNFFIDTANIMLSKLNVELPILSIILPVGISFIIFEVISYCVDIYRGDKSAKSVLDLALLVAFFPHLIAGPILKPKHFLPQLDNEIKIRWSNMEHGLQIFLLGLVKKILIADNVSPFADRVFLNPELYSSATLWLGVIAYAMQIYADFSGYSDMAIGSAKCMGLEIPRNFNFPYVSKNITEFWRRWHISLSTWLREYLYIPLGGNRRGVKRQYINLAVVMLLGGLWHGASWNFVVWGGMHGIGLAIHKLFSGYAESKQVAESAITRSVKTTLNWALTMLFVLVTWVFFRAGSFSVSSLMVKKMFWLENPLGIEWYCSALLIVTPIFIASHYLGDYIREYPNLRMNSFAGLFVVFFLLLALLYLAPMQSSPFIYFQF